MVSTTHPGVCLHQRQALKEEVLPTLECPPQGYVHHKAAYIAAARSEQSGTQAIRNQQM